MRMCRMLQMIAKIERALAIARDEVIVPPKLSINKNKLYCDLTITYMYYSKYVALKKISEMKESKYPSNR